MINFLKNKKVVKSHLIISGVFVVTLYFLIFYKISEGVALDPKNMIAHTTIVYYDGKFSEKYKKEDTKTALYILNQSDEVIYATVFEYDSKGKEMRVAIQILGGQKQFIKTDGPGVVYLNNDDLTATSTIKFSRFGNFKKYFIPQNYSF